MRELVKEDLLYFMKMGKHYNLEFTMHEPENEDDGYTTHIFASGRFVTLEIVIDPSQENRLKSYGIDMCDHSSSQDPYHLVNVITDLKEEFEAVSDFLLEVVGPRMRHAL